MCKLRVYIFCCDGLRKKRHERIPASITQKPLKSECICFEGQGFESGMDAILIFFDAAVPLPTRPHDHKGSRAHFNQQGTSPLCLLLLVHYTPPGGRGLGLGLGLGAAAGGWVVTGTWAVGESQA